jgi:hypothetical protein
MPVNTYNWLDLTVPRPAAGLKDPKVRSDGPFMHWLRRHDQYSPRPDRSSSAPPQHSGPASLPPQDDPTSMRRAELDLA